MANRTDTKATAVHGTNPQFLIDNMIRQKSYSNRFWKEKCYGLSAESIIDQMIQLKYIGGTYGGTQKPTKFLMLVLKLLQIAPQKEIVLEYIQNQDYQYVTAVALFYLRLIGRPEEIYSVTEKYYEDFRKLRVRKSDNTFQIVHMDEFAHALLNKEVYFNTVLPHMLQREAFQELGKLKPRVSPLEEILQDQSQNNEQNNNNNILEIRNEGSAQGDNQAQQNQGRKKGDEQIERSRSRGKEKQDKQHQEKQDQKDQQDKQDQKSQKKWRQIVKKNQEDSSSGSSSRKSSSSSD